MEVAAEKKEQLSLSAPSTADNGESSVATSEAGSKKKKRNRNKKQRMKKRKQ